MKKNLIEVALPLEAINKESAREKSIRSVRDLAYRLYTLYERNGTTIFFVFRRTTQRPGGG